MTVTAENLGGGGSNFPPRGTQVRVFSDSFDRPDGRGLGRQWGGIWCLADYPIEDTSRPGPYNSAVNAKIVDGSCVWWTRNAPGIGFTVNFPWPLAWMTQIFQDQFAEFDVNFLQAGATNANPILVLAYSGQPGAYQGGPSGPTTIEDSGFYFFNVTGGAGNTIAVFAGRAHFGFNPSATPSGVFGDAGLIFESIPSFNPIPLVPLSSRIRVEARRLNNEWELTVLADQTIIGHGTDGSLGPGMPAIGCSQFDIGGISIDPLASVDNFQGGLL